MSYPIGSDDNRWTILALFPENQTGGLRDAWKETVRGMMSLAFPVLFQYGRRYVWAHDSAASAALIIGRQHTQWLYNGKYNLLWNRFSGDLRHVFASEEGLAAHRRTLINA